jgi:hypothetical protein
MGFNPYGTSVTVAQDGIMIEDVQASVNLKRNGLLQSKSGLKKRINKRRTNRKESSVLFFYQ